MTQDTPKVSAPVRRVDFAFLTASLPGIADRLARQISEEMIPLLEESGMTLDDVQVTAALEFARSDGKDDVRVALSISRPREEGR